MGKDDKVGVIAFEAAPETLVPLQSAANKTRIRSDIARMQPSGGTNIAPALQQAVLELAQTRAALKHIILLTDGASPPGNIFTELATLMQVERITCSTVAVGREADRSLLKRIADAGGGRSYFTADPYAIPRIFTKETSSVARTQMVEEPFKVRVARQSQSIRGIDFAGAPYLLGYVSTKARPQAEVILTSPYGEPIYARWRRGLGKAAVFTTDVKNRWAVQWIGWPGFGKLWSQILRDLMRTNEERTFPIQLAVEGGQGRIIIDAYDETTGASYINNLTSLAAVQPPEGEKLEVPLQQTAPGRYEGRFPLTTYGSYNVSVDHADPEGDSLATSKDTLTWPYPDEYLKLEPNTALIQKAVEIGGGALDPTPARLFDPEGESVKFKSELWPYFLFAALGLFVLDLLLRRLRIYGKTAIAWEKVVGRG
jgi:Ca-activated chloride channel family protein